MKKYLPIITFLLISFSTLRSQTDSEITEHYEIFVLGTSQDGGYPQAGCNKNCCQAVQEGLEKPKPVASIAVVDRINKQFWLIDCTPDIREQLIMVRENYGLEIGDLKGIFLTHAHIGHYLGLAQLGREVMGLSSCPVYVMQRMEGFLRNNGPWSQLVELSNIKLQPMVNETPINLSKDLTIKPFIVEHRDEFSETVGFIIKGTHQKAMYVPDIDQWPGYFEEFIKGADLAFLDGTFYSLDELPGRNLAEIAHPMVTLTMELMKETREEERGKIHFIHMNHSNPIIRNTPERKSVIEKGFHIASPGDKFDL